MAKKDKDQAPDQDPEVSGEEKQVPEKPKKKYSDLSIKSVLIIVAGSLVVVVLVVFALYWFLIRPDLVGANKLEEKKVYKAEVIEDEETQKFKEELAKIKEKVKAGIVKDLSFAQTPDIITNTNPPDWYVVIQVGVEYKDVLAPAEGGHGSSDGALPPKMASQISTVVTKFCGSHSMETIINMRDSLDKIFFRELDTILLKDRIYLHKISIPKFVTQRA